jgi:hypothetical protein
MSEAGGTVSTTDAKGANRREAPREKAGVPLPTLLPPIFTLYQRIMALGKAQDRFDRACLAEGGGMVAGAEGGRDWAAEQGDALRCLALTLRAGTLRDAAAQLAVLTNEVECLFHSGEGELLPVHQMATLVLRTMASVLPIIAGAASVPIGELLDSAAIARINGHLPSESRA